NDRQYDDQRRRGQLSEVDGARRWAFRDNDSSTGLFGEIMMEQRILGSQGLPSSLIALGCMSMSDTEGRTPEGEQESIETIRRGIDSGVSLLDTGDFYGMGHNELLIGQAIRGRRDQIQLSVKFGALRDHKGAFIGFD